MRCKCIPLHTHQWHSAFTFVSSVLQLRLPIGLDTLVVIHVVLVPAFQCTIRLSVLAFWCVTHPINPALAGMSEISLSLNGIKLACQQALASRHLSQCHYRLS